MMDTDELFRVTDLWSDRITVARDPGDIIVATPDVMRDSVRLPPSNTPGDRLVAWFDEHNLPPGTARGAYQAHYAYQRHLLQEREIAYRMTTTAWHGTTTMTQTFQSVWNELIYGWEVPGEGPVIRVQLRSHPHDAAPAVESERHAEPETTRASAVPVEPEADAGREECAEAGLQGGGRLRSIEFLAPDDADRPRHS